MNSDLGSFKIGPKSLAPEILLKIFLNLESHQTTIIRSVCKEFLQIIDNNKSLWRRLECIQQKEESPIPALEMFDEKSASTLKQVSIFQERGETANRLLEILDRSKNTLTDLSLKLNPYGRPFHLKLIELASNCNSLNSLVLWPSDVYYICQFPKVHLIHSSRRSRPDVQHSSSLQVMWCWDAVKDWDGKVDVSSLVSFADPICAKVQKLHSFIIKFSSTLVHLWIDSNQGIGTPPLSSLSCPSLRILEGQFPSGFPLWLDAPNLQLVIARQIGVSFLPKLPISVNELWLLSWFYYSAGTKLGFLVQACPQLKVLKFGRGFFMGDLGVQAILEPLGAREDKVKNGVKIEGIKMMSLEKLILPINLFESAEVDQLRGLVGELIDIEDYPDFIELEY